MLAEHLMKTLYDLKELSVTVPGVNADNGPNMQATLASLQSEQLAADSIDLLLKDVADTFRAGVLSAWPITHIPSTFRKWPACRKKTQELFFFFPVSINYINMNGTAG